MEKKDINRFRWWSGSKMYNWREMKEILVSRGWIFDANGVVMSNTGLTDRNGVEIYEGDILRFDLKDIQGHRSVFNKIGEVVSKGLGSLSFGVWKFEYCKNIRVIGNRYQNPELLK